MMLESLLLSTVPGIRHAFFTRAGGVSAGIYAGLNGGLGSNDDPDKVQENRQRMAAALAVAPDKLLTLYQVHSPDVVVVDRPWDTAARPKADAMVTKVPGVALGVTTADCGPVLFVDPTAKVIGAAHAGWKGALTGVLESTLDAMETLGASRDGVIAAIGPMIRQRNYEVGLDFISRFEEADVDNARFFASASRHGHAMFDLAGYIHARLQKAGVLMVDDLDLCTYADEASFYSYRRSTHRKEPDYGRHVHAIVLDG
ncbi:polyphenol oxidase [Afipia sp. P52-10]|uniref:peptidoglycan editing factor PgeF n=1 Tax=Afipia sp. P52-10 TaxID=1429916 RepID=UPI0003DF43DD|nr:peptidoglycan editing factor PgeF [Afipia sp. P52-10]ETR78438.1 polyphenol oxidase [Afipia sp. P52-10]